MEDNALFFRAREVVSATGSGRGTGRSVETLRTARQNGKLKRIARESGAAMLPREKLLSGTTAAELTDQELLAVLLKTGTHDCNVLDLAGRILRQFGSLFDLSIADWRELKDVPGLGIVRSLELYSMFEFGRRAVKQPVRDFQREPFNSPGKVAQLLKPYFLGNPQEEFYAMFLDSRGYLLCEPKPMMRGSRRAATVGVSDVFREAVKRNASAVIAAHNHPGGASSPSPADLEITRRLIDAGGALEIELKDHVVVGGASDGDDWTSIRESGLVDFSPKGKRQ